MSPEEIRTLKKLVEDHFREHQEFLGNKKRELIETLRGFDPSSQVAAYTRQVERYFSEEEFQLSRERRDWLSDIEVMCPHSSIHIIENEGYSPVEYCPDCSRLLGSDLPSVLRSMGG